jgi:hypothetical protein
MRRLHLLLPAALLLCGLYACQETPTTASSPVTTEVTGTLQGRITVRDDDGNKVSDASGVTVSLDGTSFSATTDASGHWTIDSLPTRAYDITYSKSGYGSMHQLGYRFVGGDTVYMEADISIMPTTQVTISTLQPSLADTSEAQNLGSQFIYFDITPSVTATQQAHTTLFLMISRNATSSIDNRAGAWTWTRTLPVNTTTAAWVSLEDLRNRFGFQSGDTAYITAYSVAGEYWNPRTEQTDYASRSAATTATIVVP